jgi:hypothetical protein
MQRLVAKARRAAADPSIGAQALLAIDAESRENLGDGVTKRALRTATCKEVTEKLKQKTERKDDLDAELKRQRVLFLATHDKLVQRRSSFGKGKVIGRGDYNLTVQLLKKSIRATKQDITALKLRAKTQVVGVAFISEQRDFRYLLSLRAISERSRGFRMGDVHSLCAPALRPRVARAPRALVSGVHRPLAAAFRSPRHNRQLPGRLGAANFQNSPFGH